MTQPPPPCPLCHPAKETLLWQTPKLRVIAVNDEPGVPAFCRVIWQEHIAEMTDLLPAERQELMEAVFKVEAGMRHILRPSKINLASLGNMVPHLHWHIIAALKTTPTFPRRFGPPPNIRAHTRCPTAGSKNWPPICAGRCRTVKLFQSP